MHFCLLRFVIILGVLFDKSDEYNEYYSITIRSYMIDEYLHKRLFQSLKYVQIYLTLKVHTCKIGIP